MDVNRYFWKEERREEYYLVGHSAGKGEELRICVMNVAMSLQVLIQSSCFCRGEEVVRKMLKLE